MVAGDSCYKVVSLGTSLMAQWLGCWASTAGDMGSIPSQGIKSLYPSCHATWANGKKKSFGMAVGLCMSAPGWKGNEDK